jgi:putative transposase
VKALKGRAFRRAVRGNKNGALAPEVHAVRPTRGPATHNQQTYMVTTETWERRDLFHNELWAHLLIDTLNHYRATAYLLHEFVIMPDHLHVLLTPLTSLEKAVQFIKGGFSYRVKKELGSNMEIWQKGFADHRIRDASDYRVHAMYVRQNPVQRHLCERAEEYPYSSARGGCALDDIPQGLKPSSSNERYGAPEGAPLQSQVPKHPSAAVFRTSSKLRTS